MKKSDIVTGQEYAQNNSEYGAAQRVRVLGEGTVKQGWGYSARHITGSKIVILDKVTGEPKKRKDPETGEEVDWVTTVANREIREPWVDYAERNAAIAKSRRDSQRRLAADRRERAGFLLDLIPALRHAGFLDTTASVYENEAVAALKEQVPECLEFVEEGMRGWQFTAPLARDLAKYVYNGSAIPVPASELLRVLDGRSVR